MHEIAVITQVSRNGTGDLYQTNVIQQQIRHPRDTGSQAKQRDLSRSTIKSLDKSRHQDVQHIVKGIFVEELEGSPTVLPRLDLARFGYRMRKRLDMVPLLHSGNESIDGQEL
jgi:hypothetical protein